MLVNYYVLHLKIAKNLLNEVIMLEMEKRIELLEKDIVILQQQVKLLLNQVQKLLPRYFIENNKETT